MRTFTTRPRDLSKCSSSLDVLRQRLRICPVANASKNLNCFLFAAHPEVLDQSLERSLLLMQLLDIFTKICEAPLLLVHVVVTLSTISGFALRALRPLAIAFRLATATINACDNGDLPSLRVRWPRRTAAWRGWSTRRIALSWALANSRRSKVVHRQAHLIGIEECDNGTDSYFLMAK